MQLWWNELWTLELSPKPQWKDWPMSHGRWSIMVTIFLAASFTNLSVKPSVGVLDGFRQGSVVFSCLQRDASKSHHKSDSILPLPWKHPHISWSCCLWLSSSSIVYSVYSYISYIRNIGKFRSATSLCASLLLAWALLSVCWSPNGHRSWGAGSSFRGSSVHAVVEVLWCWLKPKERSKTPYFNRPTKIQQRQHQWLVLMANFRMLLSGDNI